MSSNERIKRPPTNRIRPLRSLTSFLNTSGFGTGESNGAAAASPPQPDGALNDVVSRSVELGYRVIDEYIRQGQTAARRFTDRSYGADTLTNDAQELATRMTQYTADFTALWFEFMQAAAGGAGRWPLPPFEGFGAPPTASSAAAPAPSTIPSAPVAEAPLTRLKVAVTSPYPTEVSLDLHPHAAGCRVVVQSLRATGGDEPRLSDVSIVDVGPDEPLTLRIRVPAGQPPGVYNGMIIDGETSLPVGTVSLRITPA